MPFVRKISNNLINNLKSQQLYINHLKQDLLVFPAIRNESIDFYYSGGNLFKFKKNDFRTNIKFAAVIKNKDNYINENDLKTGCLIKSFQDGYSRIKENCLKYSGKEDSCIAQLYSKNSYRNQNEKIVILDIEVSFEALDRDRNQDRIDILLYDKENRALQFVEAKHYENSELRSKSTPKVISQIKRYENQIKKSRSSIIKQYMII